MFDIDPSIGLAARARENRDVANSNARQADLNLEAMYEWKAHAEKLEADLAELRAVRNAEHEANAVVLAAWRKEHPVSHMHDVVGKLKDGRDIRRNFSIWATAFDEACRRLHIQNPGAWRIS